MEASLMIVSHSLQLRGEVESKFQTDPREEKDWGHGADKITGPQD